MLKICVLCTMFVSQLFISNYFLPLSEIPPLFQIVNLVRSLIMINSGYCIIVSKIHSNKFYNTDYYDNALKTIRKNKITTFH